MRKNRSEHLNPVLAKIDGLSGSGSALGAVGGFGGSTVWRESPAMQYLSHVGRGLTSWFRAPPTTSPTTTT
jgi:hypothetical protein